MSGRSEFVRSEHLSFAMGTALSCTGEPTLPEVFVDIENVEATDARESELAGEAQSAVIESASDILRDFASYNDCQPLITAAISNASEENAAAAWNAVVPNVQFQSRLYDFAAEVADRFKDLIDFLVSKSNGKALQVIDQHSLAVKTVCELCHCILTFDETVVRLPKLLGDLSYFRRTATRRSDFGDYDELYAKSSEMSMFFAVPYPLLTRCITKITAAIRTPQDTVKVLDLFAALSDTFTSCQLNHRYTDDERNRLCYKTIVCAILIYDAVSTSGAFSTKAAIHTLDAVQVLAGTTPKETDLLNLLKFGSKHYKDPSTHRKITAILE